MAKVKVKVHWKAGRNLLYSREVASDLQERLDAIAARAKTFGEGEFVADVKPGKTRLSGMVKCADKAALATNSKTNALLKSLDAGR
jgi:hypothetical protein